MFIKKGKINGEVKRKTKVSTQPRKKMKKIVKEEISTRINPENNLEPTKEFINTFKQLAGYHHSWDIWKDFITMFACALSNSIDKSHYEERERLYLETIKKYGKREQDLFPKFTAYTVMALNENPEQDFLGSIFMLLNLGNKYKGQFFTPYHLCELMAEVTMYDVVQKVKTEGYISINDPCCGGGATLIASINSAKKKLEKNNLNYQDHVFVAAQDIDITVALMCYIQLSLLGVAGYVKVGDSLMTKDSNKNCWFTPMYFSPIWSMRRLFGRY